MEHRTAAGPKNSSCKISTLSVDLTLKILQEVVATLRLERSSTSAVPLGSLILSDPGNPVV